jgi:hypothetical protein
VSAAERREVGASRALYETITSGLLREALGETIGGKWELVLVAGEAGVGMPSERRFP